MVEADTVDWRASAAARHAEFVRLVEEYHADLLRLAYAICRDRDLAADAAQSAWQAAWRQADELRNLAAVRPWLLSITANQAHRLSRRRQLGRLLELRAYRSPRQGSDADSRMDLDAALSLLSPRDRQLVALRYGLDLTSEEIAPQLGISASGVRARLRRVLQRLRKELTDDWGA